MSHKSLIIGGAGFVGSHLVARCLDNGHRVDVYDNFSRGKRSFLPLSEDLTIIEADILDQQALSEAIDTFEPDTVYHLAAIHYIPECEKEPSQAIRINVEGTQNVLNACRGKGVRLIFTSTGAIYDPEITSALSEEARVRTGDVYGITKNSAEDLVHYYVKKWHGEAIVARLFNVVGTNETNKHLIPAIMEQLAQGVRRIELGNLYPKRDYIHAGDIADALLHLATVSIDGPSDTFNVGSGVEYSVGELVEMCGELTQEPVEVASVAERRRKYDRPNQLADISKIGQTGWAPKRTLRQALEEVWNEEVCV